MVTFKCECCGIEKSFQDADEAFHDGWDCPPHFTQIVTCNLCPASGVLISRTEGKPADALHQKAHALWAVQGRPGTFNAKCMLDVHWGCD